MLARAGSRRLCQGCQQDLLVLFERGFCGPAASLRPRATRSPQSQIPRYQTRSYIGSKSLLQQQTAANNQPKHQTPAEDEEPLSDESLQEQLAALKELEERLGRPIEQAIRDDEVEARDWLEYALGVSPEKGARAYPDEVFVESVENPIERLRSEGASHEVIVREARTVFGETLPPGVLQDDEFKIYKRLYGEPASEEYAQRMEEADAQEVEDVPLEVLDQQGERLDYDALHRNAQEEFALGEEFADPPPPPAASANIAFPRGMQEEPTLDWAQEIAESLQGEILEAEEFNDESEIDGEDDEFRSHPLTALGKFATSPRTVYLSQENFVRPVEQIMSNYSNKHLKATCERSFGGPGLPDSPLTPRSGRGRKQVAIPLDVTQHTMGEMEANAFLTTVMPPTYAAITSVLAETRKRLGSTWLNDLLAKEGGPRVLDAGAGGAGILAWREVVKAHWDSLHTSDSEPPQPPPTKSVVLTGADPLRHRSAALLENTTFVPRLPDYTRVRDGATLEDDRPALQRKQFDVIIASHSLLGLKEDWMKKQHVENLWSMLSSTGGILIIIEKGLARGFEAVAGARELLLQHHIAVPEGQRTQFSTDHQDTINSRVKGMIVAPCTNHEKCPMYNAPGLSKGRRDYCSFQQRYIRPSYLQRVLGAKDRNHDDVDFSYISVMKGQDLRQRHPESWADLEDGLSAPTDPHPAVQKYPTTWQDMSKAGFEHITPENIESSSEVSSVLPTPWMLPRLVFPPMKRRAHVIMDMCTSGGKIERWTVPRSFSKQAYRDARKSKWGDLWALGAKTIVPRGLRLGGLDSKEANRARGKQERLKEQAEQMMEEMEEEHLANLEEMEAMSEWDLDEPFPDDTKVVFDSTAMKKGDAGKDVESDARKTKVGERPERTQMHKGSRVEKFNFDDIEDPDDDRYDAELQRALKEWGEELEGEGEKLPSKGETRAAQKAKARVRRQRRR